MTADPASKAKAPPKVFANKAFLSYWLAGLSTNFGWNIQIVGASWLMTLIGGTPELVALVQTFVALPLLMFSLLAGALADVFGRRIVVLWSQACLVLISAGLSISTLLGTLTPWALLAFTFLIGSCRALSLPGWQTYVNEIVPREQLPRAVSLNVVGFNIGRSLGPAVGGMIVAAYGVFAAFTVNVIANIGVFISALSWQRAEASHALPPETVGGAIAAGIRYAWLSQVQTRILVRAIAFNFSASAMMGLMPLVVSGLLEGEASAYGLLFGAFGAGAVGAAFIAPRFHAGLSREAQAHVGFISFAASLALMALSSTLVLSMPFAAIGGAAWMLVQSGFSADVQMASPRWVVSRCQAILHSVLFGSIALGSWVWGELAGSFGISVSLLASAVVLAGSSLVGLVLPMRDFDALGLEPHARMAVPDTKIDIRPNSGPIITTVEYRIQEEDLAAFFELMERRKRQRSRDGARRWTLTRDIQNSDSWFERYRLPTWTEVQRHNSRLTVFGANLETELQALHQGDAAPLVHYELVRVPGQTRHLATFNAI